MPVDSPDETSSSCYAHPAVVATGPCDRCGRPLCDTCAFTFSARSKDAPAESMLRTLIRFCPDCMLAGSGTTRRSSLSYSLGSVGCLVASMAVFLTTVALAATGVVDADKDRVAGGLLSYLLVASCLGGVTLGLIGRERARGTGSPLAIIGIIGNGVLLAVLILFSLFSSGSRQ